MASVSRDKNGNTRVLFVDGAGKRRTVYLGKLNRKAADAIRVKVEHLLAAAIARTPLDNETANWVATIGDDLAKKLAAVGLILERASHTLAAFLAEYMHGRSTDGHTKGARCPPCGGW